MVTYLNIGGSERPFSFTSKCAYQFEVNTGLPYLQEIRAFQLEAMRAIQVMSENGGAAAVESIDAVATISMRRLADLAFAGFVYAHRVERIAVDFDVADIAGWLIEEPAAMQAVASEILLATVTKQDGEPVESKKKTVTKKTSR